jgi:hypothetical protein
MATTRHELIQIDGGKLRLHFHPGQTKAWDCERRFVFVVAGTQSGKTSWGPFWLWRETQKRGAGDYLAVTATYDLFKLKMLPEMRRVFEDILHWGVYSASERVIFSNDKQSRIILRSADAEGGLESATAKGAWLDECGQDRFRLEAWEAILRRLALNQGRALGTTTPYNLGWLKTEVYDRWRGGDPDYQVIQFESIQNPAFPIAEYERAKATLPAWKFEMFYRGNFTRPAGLIYADFSEDDIVSDFVLSVRWPRWVGIDFGAVNTATVWLARDPDRDIYYLYRETLEGGKATEEHVTAALQRAGQEGVVSWHGGSKSETQQRMDWKAAGIAVKEPPIADVEAGIDRVIGLIKGHRLKVFKSCRGILDELGSYSREIDDFGQPTEKIRDKETFHRLDALRYAVIGIERKSEPSRFY